MTRDMPERNVGRADLSERTLQISNALLGIKRLEQPKNLEQARSGEVDKTLHTLVQHGIENSHQDSGKRFESIAVEDFARLDRAMVQTLETGPEKLREIANDTRRHLKENLQEAIKLDQQKVRHIREQNPDVSATDIFRKHSVFRPLGLDEPTHSPYPDAYQFSYEGQAYVIDPRLDELFVPREDFLEKYPPGKDWS